MMVVKTGQIPLIKATAIKATHTIQYDDKKSTHIVFVSFEFFLLLNFAPYLQLIQKFVKTNVWEKD